jgi:flagellar assembly protein FliH
MAPNTTPDAKTVTVRTPAMPAIERLEYGLPRPPEETSSRSAAGPSALPALQSVTSGHFSSPGFAGSLRPEESESATQASGPETHWAQVAAELEARLVIENMEARQAIAAARDEGRREGQHASETALNADQQKNQARITTAIEAFRIERQKYFKDVEREVVRLSLAIASRVLHREAQMDPLFLAGAVRVALDKLADSSGVVLRVAPAQVLVWQEMFRLSENANAQPEILGDLSLSSGECVLETRLGTIEVGVQAQLEEIEKGFFDLLDQRPASAANMAKRTV